MDLHGGITRSDVSPTKEDKCCRISLICGILKQSRNRLRDTHPENQLVIIARGESRGGDGRMAEGEWKRQTSGYTINKSWGRTVYGGNVARGIIIVSDGDRWSHVHDTQTC